MQTDRQERHTNKEMAKKTINIQLDRQTEKERDNQGEKQTDRDRESQREKQREIQTYRQMTDR